MNLLTDPWIRTTNGRRLSLTRLLQESHEIHDIYALDPQLEIGLYRFLAVVLQDVFRPRDQQDVDSITDFSPVLDFLKPLYDKFDMENFYQVDETTDPISSVARLSPEAATGDNSTHFRHRYDDEYRYCLSCCAHAMIAIPATIFGTGGGFYANPMGSVLYWVPIRQDLFSVLKACLLPNVGDHDRLWWRRPNIVIGEKVSGVSYLELMTFSPRRIKLIIEGAGRCVKCGLLVDQTVQKMHFAPGFGIVDEEKGTIHPWLAYKEDGKPVSSVAFSSKNTEMTPEKKISALDVKKLIMSPILKDVTAAKVYGMSYDKAKCIEFYQLQKEFYEFDSNSHDQNVSNLEPE